MGFSIGRFLGSIAQVAAPILGAVIGGPAGALLGTAVAGGISAGFGPTASQVGPVPLLSSVAFPRIPSLPGPTVTPTGAIVPFIAGGAGALIRALLARASAFIGNRVSRDRVLSLVRDLGLAATAAALGLSVVEVAQIIAARPRRRRRGITASQLATTKATIRRVHSINDAIASVCPPARRRVHRHHPRHHRHS